MLLPNFIGIGVPKAGTSWFCRILKQNPDIYLTELNEPHFFSSDKKFSQGVFWYSNLFDSSSENQKKGEFSTKYLRHHQKTVPRIKKVLKKTKFLCILRDPKERSISHFKWLKQLGKIPENLEFLEAVNEISAILDFSIYSDGLKNFFDEFGKSSILIINFNDLKNRPEKTIRSVETFLGVRSYSNYEFNKSKSATMNVRYRFIENLRIKSYKTLVKFGMYKTINFLSNSSLVISLRKINHKKPHNNDLSASSKLFLEDYFQEEIEKLKKMKIIDFTESHKALEIN